MNDKIELAKKSLSLSNEEWEGIGEPAREAILRLIDPVKLEDPKQEGKKSLAEGIRKVLALDQREYNKLPDYATDKLLEKVNDILG